MGFEWGAFAFGAVIGWFTYFVNRHRSEVVVGDVLSIVGALGGAAVLALFPAGTALFAAYGVGLAAGFFAYFLVLVVFVLLTEGWSLAFFLDGRRPGPTGTQTGATTPGRPMGGDSRLIDD